MPNAHFIWSMIVIDGHSPKFNVAFGHERVAFQEFLFY